MAHEMSVAEGVAKAVLRGAQRENATRVVKINLEIGELTFLNAEQVAFWLAELLKDTIAEGAEIEYENLPAKVRCQKCGYEGPMAVREDPLFHTALPVFACPACKEGPLEILEGKNCIVKYIEIDTPQDVTK